jgi:hypothetical protein
MIGLALTLALQTYPLTTLPALTVDGNAPNSAGAATSNAGPVCSNAPAPDTYGGTAGTGTPCTPRQDAARPTQVQTPSAPVSTASDGTFSGSWKANFAANPSTTWAQANVTSAPYICQAVGTTAGFTGKCWQLTTTTLPSVLTGLYGLVISPFSNPAAGIPVSVGARQ